MASYTARKDKDGNIISYQIKVSRGRDKLTGKQLTPYTTTFTPPEGWSKKAIERELNRVMGEFEAACKRGEVLTKQEQKDAAKQAAVEEMKAPTFSKYVEIFLNQKRAILSPKTVENYEWFLLKAVSVFGDEKVKDITPAEIKQFMIDMQGNEISPRTHKLYSYRSIKTGYVTLHLFFASAVEDGYREYNPMANVKPPKPRKGETIKEPLTYSEEEMAYIFKCLSKEPLKWQAAMLFASDTGCRRGEIAGLQWSDVNLKTGDCNISHNFVRTSHGDIMTTPKSGKSRGVTLNAVPLEILNRWRKEQLKGILAAGNTPTGAVFTHENGEPMTPISFYTFLKRFGEKNNLPGIHPHALRHTMATLSIANGADIISVSKKLGHSSPSTTTSIYAHANEEAQRRANEILAGALYKGVING